MDKFETVWKKIDAVLFQLLRHICALILGALVAVVFFIFFGRYVMHHSPMWGEPFSLLCLVWLSLLGSVLVVRKNEHLAVTMFDEKLGENGCRSSQIFWPSVCVFGFFHLPDRVRHQAGTVRVQATTWPASTCPIPLCTVHCL